MTDLEYIFHPKSIAVVGASPNPFSPASFMFLNPLIQFGYEGAIYPIHPKASEISGLKVYHSILDVPGPVDHVTCAIRADLTAQLMRECVAKGVKLIQLYTAGFSETGQEKGIRMEKEITEIARKGNVRVIGPNCLGMYCPESKITYAPFFPKESGSVGFLCQSGGNTGDIIELGNIRGVRFSKVVSFGNACDLNESDFIEHFTHDPKTKIIVSYIEGTKDGRRFAGALREATRVKPVIILKGGVTEEGNKMAASHTGSLAGNYVIWDSLFRQSRVIQAHDMDEVAELASLFQHLKPPKGRKIGLVGSGGGYSVLITDSCRKEQLIIHPLPEEVRKRLRMILPVEADPGTAVGNPVDVSYSGTNPDIFSATLQTVVNYDELDFVLIYINVILVKQLDFLAEIKKNSDKPMAVVLGGTNSRETKDYAFSLQEKFAQVGLPVFQSFDRATRAINKFMRYYEG